MKLFQLNMAAMTTAITMPDRTSGITIRVSNWNRLHPSMTAASSISRGTAWKWLIMVQVMSGTVIRRCAKTTGQTVPAIPVHLARKNSGIR